MTVDRRRSTQNWYNVMTHCTFCGVEFAEIDRRRFKHLTECEERPDDDPR